VRQEQVRGRTKRSGRHHTILIAQRVV
jgi:hypothetical protein